MSTRTCKHISINKEFAVDTGETFTLLMESMVARFADLDDEQMEIQRQRITAQKRWAEMELLAMDTAKRLQQNKYLSSENQPPS